jgi:uncharacterized protein (TIGR03083 family)
MRSSWEESRGAFADASLWFVSNIGLVGTRWEEPALGEWDVRALVGHTSRALLTVEAYLARPADVIELTSAAQYYQAARPLAASPAVAERGRQAGTALGEDPAAEVARVADRVMALLAARDGSELVTTAVGGMRLRDYLPTRTFELTVHTADLAVALETRLDVPPAAAAETLGIIADLAIGDHAAGPLLLAATGRTRLPPGYSLM